MSHRQEHGALRDRTKRFTSRIIGRYAPLQQQDCVSDAALRVGKQLLRSGTSIAANHARSTADRIATFTIVLQALEERALWRELHLEHELARADGLTQLLDETNQLIRIFITSMNTLRQRPTQ